MSGHVHRAQEFEWVDLAGHRGGALTKLLITRETAGSRNVDFFVSSYEPQAYAEIHQHEESEECFYFVRGTGLFMLDGTRHVVRPDTVVYVPPKTPHGIFNTGFEPLVFVVTATPPEPVFHEQFAKYFHGALQPGVPLPRGEGS